jgi:hypothetical protein
MSFDIAFVPNYFQPILTRIEEALDADVDVESFDEEWLNFTVDGYTDQEALLELEGSKDEVLVGVDALNFRIVCPMDRSSEDGLWLHSLMDSDTPDAYLRGIWFY